MTTSLFALGAGLVIWGNLAAYLAGSAVRTSWLGATLGLALVGLLVAWGRRERLSLAELGLAPRNAPRAAAIGLALALAGAIGGLVILRSPPFFGQPITYAPLATLAASELVARVALFMPLDTVIPEELAFRGVLLAALRRRLDAARAVVASTIPFTAWHVVIVLATLAETNLTRDPLFGALGLAGAFLAVFAGGIFLAVLRIVTGSLAAPLAAHWAFNTALLVGLRSLAA